MSFDKMFKKAAKKAKKEMKGKEKNAMEEVVAVVEATGKLESPVRTGTLRRSISSEVEQEKNSTKGYVGSNVEYAPIVGHKTKFLERAVDQNVEMIKRIIEEVLSK